MANKPVAKFSNLFAKKSEKELAMKEGGQRLAKIIKELSLLVEPGISSQALEARARYLIKATGAEPSFLGYRGYPAALCVSINQEVVHTPPSSREFKTGDVVSLDLGIKYQGFHTDMAITLALGEIDPEINRFLQVGRKALRLAIKKARAGIATGDIGNTIERFVSSQGFSVIKELAGHGIGASVHELPEIPNFGNRHKGEVLKQGQTICIEPMIAFGAGEVQEKANGSFVTKDNSLAAHFEHTILIKKSGAKILTKDFNPQKKLKSKP